MCVIGFSHRHRGSLERGATHSRPSTALIEETDETIPLSDEPSSSEYKAEELEEESVVEDAAKDVRLSLS